MWLTDADLQITGRKCYSCWISATAAWRHSARERLLARQRAYYHTKRGYLVLKYAGIVDRCTNPRCRNAHIYYGLTYPKKEVFYEWAMASKEFHSLFRKYARSGYQRRLSPSVDRIDDSLGYDLTNIQWLPNYLNAAKGTQRRWDRYRRGERGMFGNNPNIRD